MRNMPQFKQHTQNKRKKQLTTTGTISRPSKIQNSHASRTPKKNHRYIKPILVICIWTIVSLLALLLIASGYALAQIRQFEHTSGIQAATLFQSALAARKTNLFAEKNELTILVLGLDSTHNRQSLMTMTDTIMLVRINNSGKTTLLPLPRDLWIEGLKTKINALHYYGQESNETTGVELLNKIIFEIAGITSDHYLVIDIDHLEEIIDAIGGIDVLVERSFVDEKYPVERMSESTDQPLLYQTVSFTQGNNHFNGEKALQYMRSRQSIDVIEGTDQARSKRQQKVIEALVNKISNDRSIITPQALGKLLAQWNKLDTNIDLTTIFAIGLHSLRAPISFSALSIPIADKQNAGILTNPPVSKHNQWVWEPVDPTWNEFKQWIAQHF